LGFLRHAAALLFIVALPVALVTTNVRIAANEPRLYQYAIDEYHGPRTTGIPREELLRGSAELRAYFNNDEEQLFVRVRDNEGQLVSLFNRRETLHLVDVKNLFQQAFRVQEASVLFVLAYVVGVFIWAREGTLRTLAIQVLAAAVLSVAVIAGVGGIAVAGFDSAFDQFHEIAFDNDFWRLDPATDHLIQMFPSDFWQQVSLWIGLATLAELAGLALIAALYLGLTRRNVPVPLSLGGAHQT
jgi:integral membrane protein (TIGR01906 family)